MGVNPEEEALRRKTDAAHAKRHITIVVIVVLVLVVAGFVLRGLIELNPYYYKNRAESFRAEVQTIDIATVRTWIATLPAEASSTLAVPHEVANKIPLKDYLLNWDGKILTIYQGSGFGHWGLKILPEGDPVPESSPREYRVPFKDGSYIFHEIQ